MLFHEITKEAIQAALRDAGQIDDRKVEAQQARRMLDRLVGYKASPFSGRDEEGNLGRPRPDCRTPTLVEREREIRAFKPQEYWTIEALCEKDGQTFEAALAKVDGHKPQLTQRGRCPGRGRRRRSAPLHRLQGREAAPQEKSGSPVHHQHPAAGGGQEAGLLVPRTMRLAQDLYEGIDIGEDGAVGLITYMRTDSPRVSDTAIAAVRDFIGKNYAKPYLPAAANVYAPKRMRGFRARTRLSVRPTSPAARNRYRRYLEPDQYRLYQLIWQRFVASQMTPAVYDMTIVDFDLGQYLFRATGSRAGVRRVPRPVHRGTGEGRREDDGRPAADPAAGGGRPGRGSRDHSVAAFHRAAAPLLRGQPGQGAGAAGHRPPVHLQRHHLDAVGPRVCARSTSGGSSLPSWARRSRRSWSSKFPEIFNVEFTSEMENELDRIEDGELAWQPGAPGLLRPLRQGARRGRHEGAGGGRARTGAGAAGQGALPQVRLAHRAQDRPLRSLPRVREVQGHLRLREVAQEGQGAGPAQRREVPSLRLGRWSSRPGGSASSWPAPPIPNCKGTRSIPMGLKCPKCLEGDLTERRTKRGKSFWGCLRYPACDFSTWNRPVPETCPDCGWLGMEKKISKAEGETPDLPQVRSPAGHRRAGGGGAGVNVTVVGGGLAGSEAAWALAERGVKVTLREMRPVMKTPAHQTDRLAELVCSNSFKSVDLTNAHGLLKAELRALGSLLLPCADLARVPGGTALAVDRELFS